MATVKLSLENAKDILNWYAIEGQSNWGVWGNYPSVPVGASYDSFENCRLRILFDNDVEFEGTVFNCIATSRFVPGKKVNNVISPAFLRDLVKEKGVEFVNDFMTADKALSIKNKALEEAKKIVVQFETMSKYEYQESKVREHIQNSLNRISINKEHGNPFSDIIYKYELVIKNYAEKEIATILVDVEYVSCNARKTCATYKCININEAQLEDIVRVFTNERVASYSANLERHRKTLLDLKSKL
jgi:hypothetical protein